MSDTILQYQAVHQGGTFVLARVPKPEPGPGEICVRVKAVGLNPLDWKNLSAGELVKSWPAALGVDAAGVVDCVGPEVQGAFKPGDEVFCLCGHGGKAAAFQEVVTVPEHFVAAKPAGLGWEEAASLPIVYLTATAAIVHGLGVEIPGISPRDGGNANGAVFSQVSSVLILGGGSAVGSSAIQLLRRALPAGSIILATASPAQHGRLIALGATGALDRSLSHEQLAQQVRMHCPDGVDGILDAVAAAAVGKDETGCSPVFDLLRPDGPRKYGQVFTGEKVAVPEGTGIGAKVVFGRQTFAVPGGQRAMVALGEMSEMGEYQLPVPVEVVGTGFETIAGGLAMIGRGQVRGKKLTVLI